MKISIIKIKNLLILAAVVLTAAFSGSNLVLASPGAIFTTDAGCGGVNINHYDSKADVYLNGGPNGGGPGLPEGDYYVQITIPSGGAVLGKTLTASAHVNANGKFAQCYRLVDILSSASSAFTASGYDDTTNSGGEYKVWASKDPSFNPSQSKTDNFQIKKVEECVDCQPPPPSVSISGYKFYDYNQNKNFDSGESSIPGWKMTLYDGTNTEVGTTQTDSDGYYEFILGGGTGDYTVKEELRGSDNWQHITDAEMTVDSNSDHTGVNFGNIRSARLSGLKFRDANMNKMQDNGEGIISGIKIEIKTTEPPTAAVPNPTEQTQTVPTDVNGEWMSGLHPIGTTYKVCEIVNDPMYSQTYLQTAPDGNGCYSDSPAFSVNDNGTPGDTSDDTLNFFAPVDIGSRNFGNIALFSIGGIKYYDADLSGTFTGSDTKLAGIKINVAATKPNGASDGETKLTGANGVWTSKLYPEGTTYTVTETLPSGNSMTLPFTSWTQVASRNLSGTINGSNASADFLNVCSATPGGHTLGFWSNKNGQALITAADFGRLNGYKLRNANGTDKDFTEATLDKNKTALNSWILSANASNMAYMLSAQMTATDLSANHGFTVSSVFVDGTRTVADLIAYANSTLLTDGYDGVIDGKSITTASGAARTEQGRVKDIFDKINNGGSFKQPAACSVNY